MKNILVVVESMRINGTSSGIVSATFIQLLHQAGYSVKVITPNDFDYPVTWLPKDVICRKFDFPVSKKNFLESIPKLRALPAYLTGFSMSIRKLIEHYKKEIQLELDANNFDLIYALGTGSSFAPHFALAEMKLNIPYFLNIHDPFPMHIYPEPYRKKKNLINSKLEDKFNKTLNKATAISFPSKLLMEDMATTFQVISKKGFVVPHIGVELSNLPNENKDSSVALTPSKINIVHAGTLLGPRNPKFLLQAIVELNKENPKEKEQEAFHFFGKVNQALENVVNDAIIYNVHFHANRFSYKKSLEIIAQAQGLLVIEAISSFSPFLPGKIADIVYAEKPIISLSPKISEVRRILGNAYPYQTELDDVVKIKNVLLQFIADFKNNTIDSAAIIKIKEYVSVASNIKILKEKLL